MNALTLVFALLSASNTPTVELHQGDTAPDFTVSDTEGVSHTLSQMVNKGPVIIAFFPKANTPGCTDEMSHYQARFSEVKKSTAQLLAVSTDDVPTLKQFKESLQAPFPFVSDSEDKLVKLYNVKMPAVNFANRVTFVVDKGRKITRIVKGGDAQDPSAALSAAAELATSSK